MDKENIINSVLKGNFFISGDRKITHSALIISSVSEGISSFSNFPDRKNTDRTVNALRLLGVQIENSDNEVKVYGKGINSLSKPSETIDVQQSLESLFLMTGLLSAQNFDSSLKADLSIVNDSFFYLCRCLSEMNADISISKKDAYAIIKISGKKLSGKEHMLTSQSENIKSALFLAALFADGESSVTEKYPSHDHTENMITSFGGNFGVCHHQRLVCHKAVSFTPKNFFIPGDIYDGLFLITAALLTPNSQVTIKNISLNYSRIGFIYTLLKMGAKIKIPKEKNSLKEAFGNIEASFSSLKGVSIEKNSLHLILNELPFIMVLSLFAKGDTLIEKTDYPLPEKVSFFIEKLLKIGADIEETNEKILIRGKDFSHSNDYNFKKFQESSLNNYLSALTEIFDIDIKTLKTSQKI